MIDTDDTDESDMFSFGKVVGVNADGITLREYDFERDADVETVYYCSRDTELGNVGSLAELRVGNNVVLDYQIRDGKRMVLVLVKEDNIDEPEEEEYYHDA